MSELRDEVAIKLAAIDLGIIHNFDANLYADEFIALCRQKAIDAIYERYPDYEPTAYALLKEIEERLK